jgi:hypothetical protein
MSLPTLENLVKIGQIKAEARNDPEVRRLLDMSILRLADAGVADLSLERAASPVLTTQHMQPASPRYVGMATEAKIDTSYSSALRTP